jgi:hypothetical protein
MRESRSLRHTREGVVKEQTLKAIACARENRALGIVVSIGGYGTDVVINDMADEIDRLQRAATEETVKGPSTEALCGHHLTEAIKHLAAAAELSRELRRPDAGDLALALDRAVEAARDMRGDIEGTNS